MIRRAFTRRRPGVDGHVVNKLGGKEFLKSLKSLKNLLSVVFVLPLYCFEFPRFRDHGSSESQVAERDREGIARDVPPPSGKLSFERGKCFFLNLSCISMNEIYVWSQNHFKMSLWFVFKVDSPFSHRFFSWIRRSDVCSREPKIRLYFRYFVSKN